MSLDDDVTSPVPSGDRNELSSGPRPLSLQPRDGTKEDCDAISYTNEVEIKQDTKNPHFNQISPTAGVKLEAEDDERPEKAAEDHNSSTKDHQSQGDSACENVDLKTANDILPSERDPNIVSKAYEDMRCQ
jgi:hypothetical protein